MGEYASSITIEELVDSGPARAIFLTGPGLPFMGANWAGKLGKRTTWYPGNARGSQQVFGPQELPSSWQGMWSRTLLAGAGCALLEDGGSTPLDTPKALMDMLEDVVRAGHLLRVTWSVTGTTADQVGNIVREGRADSWNFPVMRLQDIGWEVTWDWIGRGEKQPIVQVQDDGTASSASVVSAAIANAIAKVKALNPRSKAPTSLTLGQLDALAKYPSLLSTSMQRSLQVLNGQLKQASDIIGKLSALPRSLANTLSTLATKTVKTANDFVDAVEQVPVELLTPLKDPASVAGAARQLYSATDAIALAARRSQEMDAKFRAIAAQVRREAALRAQDQAARQEGDILAIYVTKDGDTPEKVSMKFYQTCDRSIDVLRANKIPLHQPTFRRGQVLVIPRLATASQPG